MYEERCVGSLLGCLVGDVLGASVEGWTALDIKMRFPDGKVNEFITGIHMGTGRPRYGMYTDDTQSTFALAASLVEKGTLVPEHAALNYAKFWLHEPKRGYPNTAEMVLRALLQDSKRYLETGTIAFSNGSFANGGAMRITPIGLAFRHASDEVLHEAVRLAIVSSHVNPQAIDGAFIIAKAVALCCASSPQSFDAFEFCTVLHSQSRTPELQSKLAYVRAQVELLKSGAAVEDLPVLRELQATGFQIRTIDAVPAVIWALARYWRDPADCLATLIGWGGDTDTLACMAGGCLGALHGRAWVPKQWFDEIENDTAYGRDYCLSLGAQLAKLDLTTLS